MKTIRFILLAASLAAALPAAAQQPLYIVNGEVRSEIASIPPEEIEKIDNLPADEETIALYGEAATHGVVLITLRYDTPAKFSGGDSFSDYIASQVRWDDDEPAARVVLRYTVTPEGRTVVGQELEATDKRLKRRVLKAIEEAPDWQPATKRGEAVASQGVLQVQLPVGKRMPRPFQLVIR